MPSLLARFAANMFWLGRYLERAESLARILDINETYARDKPEGPDWRRILELYSDSERFDADHEDDSAGEVLGFYILDRDNPTSIASTLAAARENARSVRHLISTEMWTHLNIFQNQVARLNRRDIWLTNLARLCLDVKVGCQTFEGIAEGTFLRGEAWCFYQLGKYIERADQTTRILDMAYDRLTADDGEALVLLQADVLLRSVSGYHAFRARYPAGSTARDIVTFLLYDREFPRAVGLCIDRATDRLHDLERRHGPEIGARVEGERRELEFLLQTGLRRRITSPRLHKFTDALQVALGRLANAIDETYFGH